MNVRVVVRKAWRFFRKYRRIFYLAFAVLGLVFTFWYFSTFFTTGVDYNGAFLAKSTQKNTVVYSGRDQYGEIFISVNRHDQTEYDVSFQIPYNSKLKAYKITLGEEVAFWRDIQIMDQQGDILFDGKYQRSNSFLYDKSGIPVHGDIADTSSVNPYLNFSPNLRRMTGIATGEYEYQLGVWWKLLIGLLLFALLAVDIRRQFSASFIRLLLPEENDLSEMILSLSKIGVRLVVGIAAFCFLLSAI